MKTTTPDIDKIYQDPKGNFYQKLHLSSDNPPKVIGLIIKRNCSDLVSLSLGQFSKFKYVCERSELASRQNNLGYNSIGKLEQLAKPKKQRLHGRHKHGDSEGHSPLDSGGSIITEEICDYSEDDGLNPDNLVD